MPVAIGASRSLHDSPGGLRTCHNLLVIMLPPSGRLCASFNCGMQALKKHLQACELHYVMLGHSLALTLCTAMEVACVPWPFLQFPSAAPRFIKSMVVRKTTWLGPISALRTGSRSMALAMHECSMSCAHARRPLRRKEGTPMCKCSAQFLCKGHLHIQLHTMCMVSGVLALASAVQVNLQPDQVYLAEHASMHCIQAP